MDHRPPARRGRGIADAADAADVADTTDAADVADAGRRGGRRRAGLVVTVLALGLTAGGGAAVAWSWAAGAARDAEAVRRDAPRTGTPAHARPWTAEGEGTTPRDGTPQGYDGRGARPPAASPPRLVPAPPYALVTRAKKGRTAEVARPAPARTARPGRAGGAGEETPRGPAARLPGGAPTMSAVCLTVPPAFRASHCRSLLGDLGTR
ncbi:hypothetical protein [Bailinhaonella thermotolerans]|uniref:Uncharacterized protein n=1 Tax=Bailinhaonella thermotolerans TaxID=1070861 RepID=A0A3A4AY41_9ACTN|nr:hypothetical protein [Bailinhaonella thermotolerans]RJL26508.1 hypothetical protein D5H75_26360 [Bailinhaonella thermotolerans]